MEMDIAALEEGKESAYFLVVGNVFYEGNEGIPHSHVVGVSFADEANGGLGIDGTVKSGCEAGVLEGCVQEGVCSGIWGIDAGAELDVRESGMRNGRRHVCCLGERVVY